MFHNSCHVFVPSLVCVGDSEDDDVSAPTYFVLIYVSLAFTRLSDEENCLCDRSRKAVALWQTCSQYRRNPLCDKCRPLTLQRLQLPAAAKKKVKQFRAAFYPANHQMNLHAPLLGCSCVRSAGSYCNVNPTNPDVFGFFGRLVVRWDEGKTVQLPSTHFRILVMRYLYGHPSYAEICFENS